MAKKKKEIELIKSYWNERWAKVKTPIPTKRCDYYVSDFGRVKSKNKETGTENLLKGGTSRGLKQFNLRLEGNKPFAFYGHKEIARHFIDNPGDRKFVGHIDGDKNNNYYKNLVWLNSLELRALQKSHGVYDRDTMRKGKHVKLTEAKVRLLKQRLKKGTTKRTILARMFGITETQLKRIERGENWGYVKV